MKDLTGSALTDYKRLIKADLIVIDDIMLSPVERSQAVSLVNFINLLYENTFAANNTKLIIYYPSFSRQNRPAAW